MSEYTYQIRWPSQGQWSDAKSPPGLADWLYDNNIKFSYSVMGGYVFGISLSPEDAVAYKLRFGG